MNEYDIAMIQLQVKSFKSKEQIQICKIEYG